MHPPHVNTHSHQEWVRLPGVPSASWPLGAGWSLDAPWTPEGEHFHPLVLPILTQLLHVVSPEVPSPAGKQNITCQYTMVYNLLLIKLHITRIGYQVHD